VTPLEIINEVGIRLGYQPPDLVDDRLTLPQIELQYVWLLRDRGREHRVTAQILEGTLKKSIYWAFQGTDP
jgi:hypothetical protein